MKRGIDQEEEKGLCLLDLFHVDIGLIVDILSWTKMRVVQQFLEAVSSNILFKIPLSKRNELLKSLKCRWPHNFLEKWPELAPLHTLFQFSKTIWCKRCKERESIHRFGEGDLYLDLCNECDEFMKPPDQLLLQVPFREDGWQWITPLETSALLGLRCVSTYVRENSIRFRNPIGPGRKFRILGTENEYYHMAPDEMYLLKDVMKKRRIISINH